ncbi:hypothetical protein GWK47_018319 [Chionoecetes opilio]|uniref:Uncharacterized protein n=1 Tax=Chionoecetes opilio TaxID=41210 RepID=A0A8J4XTB5_CHIOP|nr:hypothetical protein GWK47_018319 [Chionoecetes opilio]
MLRSAIKGLVLVSPRVPAGLAAECAAASIAPAEAVGQGSSMSGRKKQDQSASGVGRHSCDGKNHLEAGSSGHKGENKLECQQCGLSFRSLLDYLVTQLRINQSISLDNPSSSTLDLIPALNLVAPGDSSIDFCLLISNSVTGGNRVSGHAAIKKLRVTVEGVVKGPVARVRDGPRQL